MPRTSIAKQMGIIAFLAVGMAALHTGSDVLADLLLTIMLALVGVAALKAMFGLGASRASWAGFALFGFGYLTLSFGPWFATEIRPHLFTSRLLQGLHPHMAITPPSGAIFDTDGKRYFVPTTPPAFNPAWVRYTLHDFERSGQALLAFVWGLVGAILGYRCVTRRESV